MVLAKNAYSRLLRYGPLMMRGLSRILNSRLSSVKFFIPNQNMSVLEFLVLKSVPSSLQILIEHTGACTHCSRPADIRVQQNFPQPRQ